MDKDEINILIQLAYDADSFGDARTADELENMIKIAAGPRKPPAPESTSAPAPLRSRSRRRTETPAADVEGDFAGILAGGDVIGGNVAGGVGRGGRGRGKDDSGTTPEQLAAGAKATGVEGGININVGPGPGRGRDGDDFAVEVGALRERLKQAKKEAAELRRKLKEAQDAGVPGSETIPPPPSETAPPEVKKNWWERNKGKLKTIGIVLPLGVGAYLASNYARADVDYPGGKETPATPTGGGTGGATTSPDFSQESRRDLASQQRNATKAQLFIDKYMPEYGKRIKNQRDWYNLALQESASFTGKTRDLNFANTVISFIKRMQAPPIPGGSPPGTY